MILGRTAYSVILDLLLQPSQTHILPYNASYAEAWNRTSEVGFTCKDLHQEHDLLYTLYFTSATILIVIVIGGIMNFLTICSLTHQFTLIKLYRYINPTASTVLILNLALADLIYSLICLPPLLYIYIQILKEKQTCPSTLEGDVEPFNTVCKFAAFIRYGTAITEWSTIGLMAFERFMAIRRFSNYRKPPRLFTANKTVVYCLIVWIIGFALQLPSLLEFSDFFHAFGYNSDTMKCDFIYNKTLIEETGCPSFDVRDFFFLVQASIPLFFIVLSYAAINRTVRRAAQDILRISPQANRRSIDIRNSRTTMMYVKIVSVFLLCVLPMCIWNIALTVCKLGDTTVQIVGLVVYCLYWSLYAINNFLYVVAYPKYRQTYRQLLSRLRGREIEPPPNLRLIQARRITKPTIVTFKEGNQRLNYSLATESKTEGNISVILKNLKPPKLAYSPDDGGSSQWVSPTICCCNTEEQCLHCRIAQCRPTRRRSVSFSGYQNTLASRRQLKIRRQFSLESNLKS